MRAPAQPTGYLPRNRTRSSRRAATSSWSTARSCGTLPTTATALVFEICQRNPKRISGGRTLSRRHAVQPGQTRSATQDDVKRQAQVEGFVGFRLAGDAGGWVVETLAG